MGSYILSKLNLLPLTYRREIADLIFFHKCVHGYYDVNLDNFVHFYRSDHNYPRTRSTNDILKLKPHFCHTESFARSYFNRIVPLWNQLHSHIRSSESVSLFKSNVISFYQQKFTNCFNSDDTCTWITTCRCHNCHQT